MKTEYIIILSISLLVSWIVNAYIVHHLAKKTGVLYGSSIFIGIIPFMGTLFLIAILVIVNDIDKLFEQRKRNNNN